MADEQTDGVEAVLAGWDPLIRASPATRKGQEGRAARVRRPRAAGVPRRRAEPALAHGHTEHWTSEDKLYCCAIKDVFFNRIVGYSVSDRMTAKLAIDAVRNAVARRGDIAGCIPHADRGSEFRSRAMARELRRLLWPVS